MADEMTAERLAEIRERAEGHQKRYTDVWGADALDLLAEVERLREQVKTLQAERAKAARQLMGLVSKYTIAHPENTLRVITLLHEDVYAIAESLAKEGPTP